MTTDDTHRIRARDAINAARRGHLPKPQFANHPPVTPPRTSTSTSMRSSLDQRNHLFETAQENSIEVYDDQFGRNTILTRSARMRKFRFYQYKPIRDSQSTPKTINGDGPSHHNNWNTSINSNSNGNNYSTSVKDSLYGTPKSSVGSPNSSPLLMPRDSVLQGKVTLLREEQSKELLELDQEIVNLEKRIGELNQSDGGGGKKNCANNDRDINNLDEIFSLVNKKNDLLRRQMQLNIIEQEKVLEKANEELTKELRSLMSLDDSCKSKAQLERQQYLYDQSLALVNKRNELVHHMDVQERCIEDDNELKATLKHVISNTTTRNKLSQSSQDQNCVIQ